MLKTKLEGEYCNFIKALHASLKLAAEIHATGVLDCVSFHLRRWVEGELLCSMLGIVL